MPQHVQDMSDAELQKTAEIHALRFMGDQVSRVAHNLDSMASSMGDMQTQMALMQQATSDHNLLWAEVTALKLRAAQQDGAFSLAKALKDFGPWLAALTMAVYAFFIKK